MSVNFNIPYSAQYNATNSEGHEHPPPAFGAPTLVWHLGDLAPLARQTPGYDAALKAIHETSRRPTRRPGRRSSKRSIGSWRRFSGGRFSARNDSGIQSATFPLLGTSGTGWVIPSTWSSPGSIRFTLWWSDDDASLPDPTADALRVKVHAGAHRDYVTLSFYLDASKSWIRTGDRDGGERRERILSAVDRVRTICEPRMARTLRGSGPSIARCCPRTRVPSRAASPWERAGISTRSCGMNSARLWGPHLRILRMCRVFANFRGLVMSTEGLSRGDREARFSGSSGAEPFPRFKGNGGIDHTGTAPPRSRTRPMPS